MKVFVIGGVTVSDKEPSYLQQLGRVDRWAHDLGEMIIGCGHDLVVCSAHTGAVDVGALKGAAKAIKAGGRKPTVEFHYPKQCDIIAEFDRLTEELSLEPKRFVYQVPLDPDGKLAGSYGWLLPQILAMDRSDAVIGLGGRQGGSASLLLGVAQYRRKLVLPFTFLGGAAETAFHARRFELEAQLGNDLGVFRNEDKIGRAIAALNELAAKDATRTLQLTEKRFFISYPGARPHEADFIEMTLRRRHYEVFRDRRHSDSQQIPQSELEEQIHRANVFIAIWCKEYACSPWCYDELAIALDRHSKGSLALWILQVDETNIVPPAARWIIPYSAKDRAELEEQLAKLIAYAESPP